MHPLNNGSQVENVPALKPRVGTPGYFSESNDNGAPSYPGQDWFNAVIREFQNALTASGVAFDPDKFDHLAKIATSYSQYGLGLVSPPLLDSFNSTDVLNNAIYRTDATTAGDSPTPGLNGVVRYERWGENDFIMYYWVATQPSSNTWVRRWKVGIGFTAWEKNFSSENLKFASQSEAETGEDNEKVVTSLNIHQAFNQYGLGVDSPALLNDFNALDKPNGSIFKTDNSTAGDSPTPGLNGVVRYERWGENDFIMYYWVATQPSSNTWVRRWKVGIGFTSWEQVFSTGNLTPYESTTLFYNLSGVGDGTIIDWSSSGKVLDDFRALRVSGFFDTGSYKHHMSVTIPIDIAKSISGANDCLFVGGFTAKGSSNNDVRVTLTNITQSQANVDILNQGYSGAITRVDGISY
ncbi:hypothetical protein [Vibrio sp. ER1A]|uniref:hypothetical protein n=1 Tax=Vibrio sp. ER1A TaxID=1517681 RepID=UPI0004DD1633|nr:hypothetical protein [Vibrio sp. ER1A]KFA96260.1 hypothetical protein HW45_20075 [Vibrio sp. ER1A]